MSEEINNLAQEMLNHTRHLTITRAIHTIHKTQSKTIMAILKIIKGEQQQALDSAESALDNLLESQDELDRVLTDLDQWSDRLRAWNESQNG